MRSRRTYRFSLVNLGCPKNTVDSEGLLGSLALAGFRFVEDPADADLCVVNTCGFLDAARREAAGVLRELALLRGKRNRPKLVATGCLVERAGGAPELSEFLAAADARAGFRDYARLPELCRELLEGTGREGGSAKGFAGRELPRSYFAFLDRPRMRIGFPGSAYLKLGEGCSNHCAYCSIPLIRGQRASRPMKAIWKEARELVEAGARELNLIAQDTTAYGLDRTGRPQLADLLRGLLKMPGELWFRLLYAHPRHLDEEMLAVMVSDVRVCPYLDLPLQHITDRMLKAMGRGYGRKHAEEVLEGVRRHWPDAAIRTTFIVGHPGEREADFQELLKFVGEGRFDHLGVFAWSPEPGTASVNLGGRVPPSLAEARRDELMRTQAGVSAKRLRARRGQETSMLLEEETSKGWRGRTVWQAPEVDGNTLLEGPVTGAHSGRMIRVILTGAGRYDCRARSAEG